MALLEGTVRVHVSTAVFVGYGLLSYCWRKYKGAPGVPDRCGTFLCKLEILSREDRCNGWINSR